MVDSQCTCQHEKYTSSQGGNFVGYGLDGKDHLLTCVYDKLKDIFEIHAWLTVSQTYRSVDALLKDLLKIVSVSEHTTTAHVNSVNQKEATVPVDIHIGHKEQLKPDDIDKMGILDLKSNLKAVLKHKK